MKFGQPSSDLVNAIQALIAERTSVDVRVRCKDHQPSDGLGAHRLILAAASPNYLKNILLESSSADEELICLHMPDYTSIEVGPVMSLIYYGETWIDESHAQICKDILQDLKMAIQFETGNQPTELNLKQEKRIRIKREPVDPEEEASNLKLETLKLERNVKVEPPDSDDNASETITVTPAEHVDVIETPNVACQEPGCSYKTSSLSSLQSHRLIHGRRKEVLKNKRTCPACQTVLETPKATRDHALESHGEIIDETKHVLCIMDPNCQWKISLNSDTLGPDFLAHLREKHVCEDVLKEEGSQFLHCDMPGCDYVTNKGYNMTQHIKHHNDERKHDCPVCSKSFRTSTHLRDHIKAVHTKERTFQCSKCPRAFASAWQAKSHMKSNHGVKSMYECKLCLDKSYKTHQALAGHVKSFHSKSARSVGKVRTKPGQICESCGQVRLKNHQCQEKESQNTNCPVCHKEMSGKSLKAHLQYHRKKQVSSYLCQFCNKSFTTETSLKRHILIHENLKPFTCPVCEKSFRQKCSLIAHERVHNGIRFDCQHCQKKFITKSLLTKHMNTSHVK